MRSAAALKRKSTAPFAVPLSNKPFYAKKGNVTGMPRENIEEACDDGRELGIGAVVVDSGGVILVRWVSSVTKAFLRSIPE